MDIKRIGRGIDEVVDRRAREIAISVYNDAVENTPVKSGNLKLSWRITKGSMEPLQDKSTGQSVQSNEVQALLSNSGEPYETIYVYNVAKYAIYVERDQSILKNAIFIAKNKK